MRRFFSLTLLLVGLSLAKPEAPRIEPTAFESNPSNLFYFPDSDVVLITESTSQTAYRSDDAGTKWQPILEKGGVLGILKHPTNHEWAVALGKDKQHWVTSDVGKTWQEFKVPALPTASRQAVVFHGSDPKRMMFLTADCMGFDCEESVYYTTDGFDTNPKLLREDASACIYAKSTDQFTTGDDDLDLDQVLCIVSGVSSPFASNYRLLSSSDYFQDDEVEPELAEDGRTVSGIINIASVKSYLVAAAKSEGTTEMAMYVTDNAKTWHRAVFAGHKLEEDAYTLLESTNYSMQVDVLTSKPTSPMGVLLTSNSNGTFFRKNIEHTNRNMRGFVDFEKIQDIQGIVMVNVVDNWEEVERKWLADKDIKTQISFDDGRNWQSMRVGDDKELHLHSVTNQRNTGRIFSSPAPGIVMGVGNTGKFLGSYDEGDTYVSDDAGLTWTRALRRPHLYEIGDQGAILVAVEDEETDEIKWSLDHGKNWKTARLEADDKKTVKIKPLSLTTTPDSTSLKFILTATKGKGSKLEHFLYALDFTDLHEDKCGKRDFEDWYARVDEKGDPTCIMGHTQMYRRRKADANCFVGEEFKDPQPVMEDCKCTNLDFECDYEQNFVVDPETKKCVASGPLRVPTGKCKEGDKTYMGTSGYKLIPGNTCVRKGGVTLDEEVERDCKDAGGPPASGKIATEITKFRGDKFLEYYYLERKDSNHVEQGKAQKEAVIMRTDRREAWLTEDHGKTWSEVDTDGEEVVAIYPHQYLNDQVYLVTPSTTVYYSKNFGETFHSFDAPEKPNQEHLQILQFHPDQKDWLIWTGGKSGQTIAHVSTKGGDEWNILKRSVRKCQFVYREDRDGSDQLVYCEQYADEESSARVDLLSSDDWFEHSTVLKKDVINFATMAEYIVVAVRDADQQSLQVDTSIDGHIFADAQFPSNFKVKHQQAYTVLDSSTHAVFLHVTVNSAEDGEYGSIIKSNSNGTSYVLSIGEVNRNGPGYVDFEKMQGLEGVAIINRVANAKEADGGSSKKLKTYITHNDGADWALLTRPEKTLDGKAFPCSSSGAEKCSLHLHGYTERKDARDTFSSPSAVGLMMGTGNVGEFLGYKKDADTFLTRDGGVTWNAVAPGNWMWEYGDQGSILVIVNEGEATRKILYSLDEGETWIEHTFTDNEMMVDDITTVPSDTSRNFMLWGHIRGDLVSVNIDFSGLEERSKPCHLDEQHPEARDSDYWLWSPSHPLSEDKCLFGHVARYHRKKLEAQCYNGREIKHLHNIASNCTCTRRDFECDYNYERQTDGSCSLVSGLTASDPAAVCKDKNVVEYYETTGYRRIPLTTCEGGQELDYTSRVHPCPGKEDEYQKRHGISGAGLFFAIVLPIAAAAGIGYWVYRNWDGKFGRIQLGDGFGGAAGAGIGNAFDREQPWIKFPVMLLSGVVAVLAALPMVVGSIWGAVSSRLGRRGGQGGYGERPFTSRSSFQRGRGDYAVVDPDEGELLGEESDEEV
ncbi:hypothetical protein LTR62_005000 [Meristemomyces frigidus]|uniref:Vacuolar protein sorting/targeting protein 10 n=1 Tax=Meristemomyces frigidus TaxID=1508187 RepID=A0AAN7TPI8_9PEZI|nr:hypothetical protein LTR62_005000 [Meristemomyces frigidus]